MCVHVNLMYVHKCVKCIYLCYAGAWRPEEESGVLFYLPPPYSSETRSLTEIGARKGWQPENRGNPSAFASSNAEATDVQGQPWFFTCVLLS